MLSNLLPRNKRKDSISKLENYIGFKLYILRPPHWITNALIIIFILSLIVIFINWKIGLSSIVFSLLGLWLTNKIGNELDLNTVGDIAKKMTRDNYIKSRRNTKTFNKMEIEKVLTDLFCTDLELDRNKLIRESKFI